MKSLDTILSLLIPTLILLHLLIAPYTKVEESFNIQATHDIVDYSFSTGLRHFDHVDFPGAVPRTFVGALGLAAVSKPIIALAGAAYAQFIVRAMLGLLNAFALLRYGDGLADAFGSGVRRWYILLQAAQFHVIYYASRTLPNMFAFALTTLALREFLPVPADGVQVQRRQRLGIYLFVLAGVIFRSEVALLLFIQLAHLLILRRMSLQTIVPAGLQSALIALAISVPIDSYFWQKPVWPELWGFYYNAIQGKSADWGTSPYAYYFISLLPRLLLNPLIMVLLTPLSFMLPALQSQSRDLVVPAMLFVAIYSLQPHKESRFIIYVVPPITAAASLAASYIWTRRAKSLLYRLASLAIAASLIACFAASTAMLLISTLNYPGGEAIAQLQHIIAQAEHPASHHDDARHVRVHMDVLSCMTGVTRFQEMLSRAAVVFDKEEYQHTLLRPGFWEQFDYALMEEPEKAIGRWDVVATVYAYAGLEIFTPGDDGGRAGEDMERVDRANNVAKEEGVVETEPRTTDRGVDIKAGNLGDLKARLLSSFGAMSRFEMYTLVKDAVRLVTGGYWIGPRMEPAIRILKRVQDPFP